MVGKGEEGDVGVKRGRWRQTVEVEVKATGGRHPTSNEGAVPRGREWESKKQALRLPERCRNEPEIVGKGPERAPELRQTHPLFSR